MKNNCCHSHHLFFFWIHYNIISAKIVLRLQIIFRKVTLLDDICSDFTAGFSSSQSAILLF